MAPSQMIELAAALLLVGGGVWLMRRRDGDNRGSQGGVILLFIGALVAIHALGLTKYRPSPAELEARS